MTALISIHIMYNTMYIIVDLLFIHKALEIRWANFLTVCVCRYLDTGKPACR